MKTGNMSLGSRLSGVELEFKEKVKSAVVLSDEERLIQCLQICLDCGINPASIIESLVEGLRESINLYERRRYFLPEFLMSFNTFLNGIDFLRSQWGFDTP